MTGVNVGSEKQKICVLGAGAFGSALACVATRAGHETRLWTRSDDVGDEVNAEHTNSRYLGSLKLEAGISATTDLNKALCGANYVLLAIPTQNLGGLLAELPVSITQESALVSCAKGIDQKTGLLPSELIAKTFPNARIGALSGPSFASDIVQNLPTAVTVAGNTPELSAELAQHFSAGNFRCYASDDLIGVQLGGALKNVLAIAVGASRGMGLGPSAEAALIARGFAEIRRVAIELGAERETLSGLSGLGDLAMCCSSTQSRNFTYGIAMGRNEPRDNLPLAEGAYTASIALEIARREGVDTPIIAAVVDVLEARVTVGEAVEQLLLRPLKREGK